MTFLNVHHLNVLLNSIFVETKKLKTGFKRAPITFVFNSRKMSVESCDL